MVLKSYAIAVEDVRYVAPMVFSAAYAALMFVRNDLVCEKESPELESWLSDRGDSKDDCIL